jgi:hypothetical protein
VLAIIPFTDRPGARDAQRIAKRRPCVVEQVLDETVLVRPILDGHGSARRHGFARSIKNWRQAGLRKPSAVLNRAIELDRDEISRPIGQLAEPDQARLLGLADQHRSC